MSKYSASRSLNTGSRFSTVSTASSGYYQFKSEFSHLQSGRGRSYRSPFNTRAYQPPSSLAKVFKDRETKDAGERQRQAAEAVAEASAEAVRAAGGSPLMAALAKQGVPIVLLDDEGKTAFDSKDTRAPGGFTPIAETLDEGAIEADAAHPARGAGGEAKTAPGGFGGFGGGLGDVVRIRQTRDGAATAESAAQAAQRQRRATAAQLLGLEHATSPVNAADQLARDKYFGKRAKPAFFAASRAFDKLLPRLDAPPPPGPQERCWGMRARPKTADVADLGRASARRREDGWLEARPADPREAHHLRVLDDTRAERDKLFDRIQQGAEVKKRELEAAYHNEAAATRRVRAYKQQVAVRAADRNTLATTQNVRWWRGRWRRHARNDTLAQQQARRRGDYVHLLGEDDLRRPKRFAAACAAHAREQHEQAVEAFGLAASVRAKVHAGQAADLTEEEEDMKARLKQGAAPRPVPVAVVAHDATSAMRAAFDARRLRERYAPPPGATPSSGADACDPDLLGGEEGGGGGSRSSSPARHTSGFIEGNLEDDLKDKWRKSSMKAAITNSAGVAAAGAFSRAAKISERRKTRRKIRALGRSGSPTPGRASSPDDDEEEQRQRQRAGRRERDIMSPRYEHVL